MDGQKPNTKKTFGEMLKAGAANMEAAGQELSTASLTDIDISSERERFVELQKRAEISGYCFMPKTPRILEP